MKPRCRARGLLGCVLLALSAVLLLWQMAAGHGTHGGDVRTASGRAAEIGIVPALSAESLINAGDAAALVTLPGVGEVTAQKILQDREENGPFHYPEDLLQVSGIGEYKLEKIRPYLEQGEE